jgi:hypothetical protein
MVKNNATLFVTANGARLTPDMPRRSLICELHLSEENSSDRKFKRVLNNSVIRTMRPQILAACWALVRHWDELGRPVASRSRHDFHEWAQTIGGIVEAAGFGCVLATPNTTVVFDEETDGMGTLMQAMKLGVRQAVTPDVLYQLCRTNEVFTWLVGLHEGDMDKSKLSSMGSVLKHWDDRACGDRRFHIKDKGHKRKYWVEMDSTQQHGQHGQHGLVAPLYKSPISSLKVWDHADHADHATAPPPRFTRAGARIASVHAALMAPKTGKNGPKRGTVR